MLRLIMMKLLRLRLIFLFILFCFIFYSLKTFSLYSNEGFNLVERNEPIPAFMKSTVEKVDWHNYKLILNDLERKGIGEQGVKAFIPESHKHLVETLYSVNGFNAALSDLIALNRSLPDYRHKKCKYMKYYQLLPTVAVVIPFHNEHWSTLLRTVISVVNRSPEQLLKEIILVDDASSKTFLKEKLDNYLKENIPIASIIRLVERSGLIKTRVEGIKKASADVIIVLDSHSEVTNNWLPPLLDPIADDYRTVVCPFIDVIDYETFEYKVQDNGARGAFDWQFFYKRLPLLPDDVKNLPQPFKSPVMAGGLFAMSRKFFWELGGYDEGLDIWGGEQYELSFKLWQCGGQMFDAPCSRVGHLYRKFAPFPNPNRGDFVSRNYRRVAEVWMDEYAKYIYKRKPSCLKVDPGNLTELIAIRKKLQCKSFKWFMNNVAFDLPHNYPYVDPPNYGSGTIKNVHYVNMCIDAMNGESEKPLFLKLCLSDNSEQQFVLGWKKDISIENRNVCWDLPETKPKSNVVLYHCHGGKGNQLFKYNLVTKQIEHGNSCVDVNKTETNKVFVTDCDVSKYTQKWIVEFIDRKAMKNWHKEIPVITAPTNVL